MEQQIDTGLFVEGETKIRPRSLSEWSMDMIRRASIRVQSRHYVRKIWNFRQGGVRIILSSLKGECDHYGNATGTGEILGLSVLMPILHSVYAPESLAVELSDYSEPKLYERCNLILLGGPKRNHVTKHALKALKEKGLLGFEFRDHKLYDLGSEESYEARFEDGFIKEDFGLVIKAPNPFREDRLLYILAGCRTFGVYAAASILTAHESLAAIAERSGEDYFSGVVKVVMSNYPIPQSMEVVQWRSSG